MIVENYAPGVIARLGFGYEAVRGLHPKIIMCSISTFGQNGPLANRPGYDFIGCAYSGVLSMIGERDGAPSLPAVGIGDISTGVHAVSAIVAALLHRERTGEAREIADRVDHRDAGGSRRARQEGGRQCPEHG